MRLVDPLEALDILYSKVVHVHLKDFAPDNMCDKGIRSVSGRSYVNVVAGEGVPNLREFVQKLNQYGYDAYLSVETQSSMVSRSVKNVRLLLDCQINAS